MAVQDLSILIHTHGFQRTSAKIYSNEGIAQVLFFEGDEQCEITYAQKKGKYQFQKSIELPKL